MKLPYEVMAETQCPHYPDGEPSDVPVVTMHGPEYYPTESAARAAVSAIISEGCIVFHWAIFRRRVLRHDELVDSWQLVR